MKKYSGKLGKPRPYRHFPPMLLLGPEDAIRAWEEVEHKERTEILAELCALYQVPAGNNMALLWALLEAHVPAWRRERAPRGQKRRWTVVDNAELHADVEDIMVTNNLTTVMSACRALMRKQPWKGLLWGAGNPAVALSKHHYAADLRVVRMVRHARVTQELERMYPGVDLEEIPRTDPDAIDRAWNRVNPGACNANGQPNSAT